MILSGVSCTVTVLLSEDAVTETLVLFLVSKFFISASFLIIYPFAGELYPTQLRGIGIGMSAYVAGLGLILIPFVTYLGTDVLVLPLVILGVVSVVGGLSGLRLPETLHHRLPQTVEDGEEFGKDWTLAECLRCIPVRPSVSGSYEGLSDGGQSLEMSSQKPAENEIRFQDEATPFGKDSAVRMSKRIPQLVHQSSTMESPVDTCGAMKMTYWF